MSVLDGQIDAVSRDITRNLRENELTGNTSAAIGGGNMGSSMKQKLDFGAGQRAADRIADASSQMRGQAYNAGMNIEAGRASENAQLTQSGNQFNANLSQSGNQFNTNALNANNQFNANLSQSGNQYNTSAQNAGNQFNANAMNAGNQFNTSADSR